MPATPLSSYLQTRADALGLSAGQIAEKIGAGQSSVYGWLAGDHPPAPNRYASLAAALGVPLRDLVLVAHGAEDGVKP